MNEVEEASIAEMRVNYGSDGLCREDLDPDPFLQFDIWFREACEAGIREPNAMTLSTLGLDGIPTGRTVLLKDFDSRGFTFYTNYRSRKGREIEARPAGSLLFFWRELERQVQIRGRVVMTSQMESETYFSSRPYASRIGAHVSRQSEVIPSREWLEERDREFRRRYPDTGSDHCVPLPDHWGGYRVFPLSIEFWQGGAGRLHDRFQYDRGPNGSWVIARVSP